jgi:hypothetical protein
LQKDHDLSTSEIHVLSLAATEGALDFYDFIIFVFFARVMGKLFFAVTAAGSVRQAQAFDISQPVTWQDQSARNADTDVSN